jgi:hypothetical protein
MPSETRRIGLPPARASLPSSFRTVGKEPMSNNQLALNFFSLLFIYKTEQKESTGFFCWTVDEKIQPLFITCWYMVVIDGHVFLCLTSMVVALLKQVTVLFLNRHFVENVCVYGVVSHAKNVLFLSFSHIFPRNLPNLKWHWE